MSKLTILFILLSLTSIQARITNQQSKYCLYKLIDKGHVWGEYLETYEDRWFYQSSTPTTQIYQLLFKESKTDSPFHFLNQKEIDNALCWTSQKSNYRQYLKKQNLFFKNKLVENAHILTGNEGHHKHEAMFGNFAWDIGIVDKELKQHSEDGSELSDYYIFGASVISPVEGVIIDAVTDQEDNPTDQTFSSDLSSKINNYLIIQTSTYTYLSVVHFKEKSIPLKVGDTVEVGTYIGQVGNSGVSYLPHLHYTLYTYSKTLQRFISIPGFFTE